MIHQLASLVSCNRTTHSFDIDRNSSCIAYAANNAIKIFQTPSNSYFLSGHDSRVTGLRFLKSGNYPCQKTTGLVSISSDKTAIIWRFNDSGILNIQARVDGHQEGITCLGVVRGDSISSGADYFATGSSDNTIRIYRVDAHQCQCVQVVNVGNKYALALEMAYLPNTNVLVLFAAGTDKLVTLYVQEGQQFTRHFSLQGHSAWIHTLSVHSIRDSASESLNPGCLLLASGSQDRYIRIWKVSSSNAKENNDLIKQLEVNTEEIGVQFSTNAHILKVDFEGQKIFTVMFDALLMGHDDWVHSVDWNTSKNSLEIVSASSDKSIMIWTPDTETKIWTSKVQVGDVGGASLGFYNAMFGLNGDIIGHAYNGSLQIWANIDGEYRPNIGISGHFAPVKDIAWDPSGMYFISVSLDETARLIAPWNKDGKESWHEISRPQIHGYPLKCLAFYKSHAYISGADAPATFVKSLHSITGNMATLPDLDNEARPAGASLPALGLSNKAITVTDIKSASAAHDLSNRESFINQMSTPTSFTDYLTQPPVETHIIQHTLWPEINKLYGHGYELMSVACCGDIFASSCKASKAEYAAIRFWSTRNWQQVCEPIQSHNLTATKLSFSNSANILASVGRDRAWALYHREKNDSWKLLKFFEKAHARIIWDTCFTPCDKYFFTASRDKSVKIWSVEQFECVGMQSFVHAATSLDVAPKVDDKGYA